MIRTRRRRVCIYIGCFLCFLLFNLLTNIQNPLYPSDTVLTPDEIATKAILDAVGLRNTTSASKLLPSEYTVVLEPEVTGCQDNGRHVNVLFMVISSPENRLARNAIRQSVKPLLHSYNNARLISRGTGSSTRNITLLFFAGVAADPNIQDRLEEEAKEHGDIVIDNMIDTYLLLSLKVLRMFKWVRAKCTNAQFIVKIDDDVHLNLLKFIDFINSVPENKAQDLIAGHVYKGLIAVRSKNSAYGKWYIPYEMMKNDELPTFVAGFFYTLGRNAMERIYQASLNVPLFHLEDVFLTGMIASDTLKMNLTDIPYIHVAWGFFNSITTTSCQMRNEKFVAHPVTPIQLKCWSQYNQLDFQCGPWPVIMSCMV